MSTTFTITGPRRIAAQFGDALDAWAEANAPALGSPTIIDASDDKRTHWVFGMGSIRGFTVQRTVALFRGTLEVRVNALASRADWRLCYLLLRHYAAMPKVKVTDEEGHRLELDALTEAQADTVSQTHFAREVATAETTMLEHGVAQIALPNWYFELRLTREELLAARQEADPAAAVEQVLARKGARYAAARLAGAIALTDGRTIGVWAAEEPVLITKVTLLAVPRAQDDLDPCFVPWLQALTLLSERAEQVGDNPERYYLPPINFANPEDRELHARLVERAVIL